MQRWPAEAEEAGQRGGGREIESKGGETDQTSAAVRRGKSMVSTMSKSPSLIKEDTACTRLTSQKDMRRNISSAYLPEPVRDHYVLLAVRFLQVCAPALSNVLY